ncbi:MAG: hypothetical protein IPO40_24840 [Fibrobacteres bacterium]|nr:hypothetical protein [Fibrobacterota bacterium]
MRVVIDLLPWAIALAPVGGGIVAVVQKRRQVGAMVRGAAQLVAGIRAADRGARDGELDF